VANDLGVSPSVISEVLRSARHDAVLEADEAVAILLDRALSPQDAPSWIDQEAQRE
jgi:hypothetical protein